MDDDNLTIQPPAPAPAWGADGPQPGQPVTTPIEFTGLGGEYFRIWIVNLLLMLVTFGIYYPWAKVRKLRYFYGHTLVDGHALDFHGSPSKMLRGTALVGVLLILYSIAGEISPVAGGVALIILAAIWPALFRASMQFRLANTSWRGLRFRFDGSMRDTYVTFGLPIGVVALILFAIVFAGGSPATEADGSPAAPTGAALAVPLLGVLLLPALVPWFWFRLKKFQHDHYGYGPLRTELRSSVGAFYGLFARVGGVSLLAVLAVMALLAAAVAAVLGGFGALGHFRDLSPADKRHVFEALAVVLPFVALAMLLVQLAPRAYFMSRMQNLLWSRTGNRFLRFKSQLGFRALWWLMLKNWLLVAVTLGLYWPWAAVALARLRMQSMSVVSRIDLGALASAGAAAAGDAAGDAAADLFGLDVGL